jgi:hypothetical protein
MAGKGVTPVNLPRMALQTCALEQPKTSATSATLKISVFPCILNHACFLEKCAPSRSGKNAAKPLRSPGMSNWTVTIAASVAMAAWSLFQALSCARSIDEPMMLLLGSGYFCGSLLLFWLGYVLSRTTTSRYTPWLFRIFIVFIFLVGLPLRRLVLELGNR